MNRSKQFRYWRMNWRSGLIRLLERLLIGKNISDVLAGDLSQFRTSKAFYSQVLETRLSSSASILQTIRIDPIGSKAGIELSGINRGRHILKIASARVDSYTGLVTTDTGLIIDSTLAHWQKLIYMGGLLDSCSSPKRKPIIIEGSWAVLPFSDYFYHTLVEEIATLLAIREEFPDFNVITFTDTPKWALDLLSELGFSYRIVNKRALLVENLFCATSVGVFSGKEFERFSKAVAPLNLPTQDKIFVSRGKLSRHDENLENQILKILQPAGFRVIISEELSIHDQILTFRNASAIVSFHGGALSHLVWCSKGTRVLEIFNHPFRTYDFARIAFEGELIYSAIDTANTSFNPEMLKNFYSSS